MTEKPEMTKWECVLILCGLISWFFGMFMVLLVFFEFSKGVLVPHYLLLSGIGAGLSFVCINMAEWECKLVHGERNK